MVIITSSLVLLFVVLLFSAYSEVLTTWEPAPLNILEAALLPYEKCLLNLPTTDFVPKSIFSQTKCESLIDEQLKKLPQRCWLAAKHQHQNDGLCVYPRQVFINDVRQKCRPLESRSQIKYYWSNLPSYSTSYHHDEEKFEKENAKGNAKGRGKGRAKGGNIKSILLSDAPASKFYQAAKRKGFEIIAFAGDSMAVLFGQRLACASMRQNVSSVSVFQNFFSARAFLCDHFG